jgi:hypothetical protein
VLLRSPIPYAPRYRAEWLAKITEAGVRRRAWNDSYRRLADLERPACVGHLGGVVIRVQLLSRLSQREEATAACISL